MLTHLKKCMKMQQKTEVKPKANTEAIQDLSKRVRSENQVYIPDEEKVAYRLAEAGAIMDKIMKKTRNADVRGSMFDYRKNLFAIEDYFYHLAIQKTKEHEQSKKQPELFGESVSPSQHGV